VQTIFKAADEAAIDPGTRKAKRLGRDGYAIGKSKD
jgi:hypothetical protein